MIFAFYGTLRPNQGNFDRFNLSTFGKILGTYVVGGFNMISINSWYPMVFKSDNKKDKITVELVEIHDVDIIRSINGMEVGAGYVPEDITINGHKCKIYVSPTALTERDSEWLIPSGDWVKEYNTKNKYATRTRGI